MIRRCQGAVRRTVRLHEFNAQQGADTTNVADPRRIEGEERLSEFPAHPARKKPRFVLEMFRD